MTEQSTSTREFEPGGDPEPTVVVPEAGLADLVATVWFRLGYRPHDSLVVVALEGARRRVGLILRVDLPPPGEPELLSALAQDLVGHAARAGGAAVLAMVAADDALRRPVCPAVAALERAATEVDVELVDVVGVTRAAFGSLTCPDVACCPPAGHPIDEVTISRAALAHVLDGDAVAESEAELLADLRPDVPDHVPVGAGAGGGSGDTVGGAGRLPGPRGLTSSERRAWWGRWLRLCAVVADSAGPPQAGAANCRRSGGGTSRVDPSTVGPSAGGPAGTGRAGAGRPGAQVPRAEAAALGGALHDPGLRDAVLVHLLGADPALAAPVSSRSGDPRRRHRDPGTIVSGLTGPQLDALFSRPPHERPRDHPGRAVLAATVRSAGRGDRAPALAVLAFLAWVDGSGGLSRMLVERARADSTGVSLIRLVEDMLVLRVPPPWRTAAKAAASHPPG